MTPHGLLFTRLNGLMEAKRSVILGNYSLPNPMAWLRLIMMKNKTPKSRIKELEAQVKHLQMIVASRELDVEILEEQINTMEHNKFVNRVKRFFLRDTTL